MRSARTAAASARSVTVASVAARLPRGRGPEPERQQHPASAGTDEHPGDQEQGGNGVHARRVPVRTDRTARHAGRRRQRDR